MSTRRNKEDVDSFSKESFERSQLALISFASAGKLSCSRFLACVCLLLFGSSNAGAQDKKMDLPEVISRHQESVGTAAARGGIKGRFAQGTGKYVSRMGSSP